MKFFQRGQMMILITKILLLLPVIILNATQGCEFDAVDDQDHRQMRLREPKGTEDGRLSLTGKVSLGPGVGGTGTDSSSSSNIRDVVRCATKEPSTRKKQEVEEILKKFRQSQRFMKEQDHEHDRKLEKVINVPVYFHVISASDGTGAGVTDSQLRKQIDVMNSSYSGMNNIYMTDCDNKPRPRGLVDVKINFSLAGIDRTTNDDYFYAFQTLEVDMRVALHNGGCDTLNVYTKTFTDSEGYYSGYYQPILGWSNFPWDFCPEGTDSIKLDGISIDYKTLPDGEIQYFDRGGTLVHECGHWLGLYHTFSSSSLLGLGQCNGAGDYIADTPIAKVAAYGCPIELDSCPFSSGKDSITNYLNYSDDCCMNTFTYGQSKRIHDIYAKFRDPAGPPPATETPAVGSGTFPKIYWP